MKNIVLIGMPGTGKTVVGKALAKRLSYRFVDADDLIQEHTGQTLPEILRNEGVDTFLSIEQKIGETLTCENTVIATGGSMVCSKAAMDHLRENGVVVWLETPLSTIKTRMPDDLTDRGIAALPGKTIEEIYHDRKPLFAEFADLIIAGSQGEDTVAARLQQVMRTIGMQL